MKAFKGFNPDLTCRGFQYEEGKTYELDGEPKLCNRGFHACENPLDVFSYYPPTSPIHEVNLEGVSEERDGNDTKVAAKKITIGARISLSNLTKIAVDFIFSKIDWKNAKESNTGYQSAAEVSGKDSVAIATGYESKVRGKKGCSIVCVERGKWNGSSRPIIAIKSGIVDGEVLKEDVWYTVKNGEWVEVK